MILKKGEANGARDALAALTAVVGALMRAATDAGHPSAAER